MAAKTQSKRALRIVLDTNAIFAQVAHDLVTIEISDLIQGNTNHPDLNISWHLPETVVEERAFQMREKAAALLPSIDKVERLLGLKLAITKDTLDSRVNTAIETQLSKLNIQVAKLDVEAVDWRQLITSAHRREPPFQAGEKEKGFRDSLILETFVQLVAASPRTPSVCRIVLVTGDVVLTTAARARVSQYNNVQIFSSVDELKNLINTLASQVDEHFVNELQEKASLLFFSSPDNKDCLFYKEKIRDRIMEKFSQYLEALPEGAEVRESEGIIFQRPRFLKKEGQRISWVSTLRFRYKAYRYEKLAEISSNMGYYGNPLFTDPDRAPEPVRDLFQQALVLGALANITGGTPIPMSASVQREKRLVKSGADIFEVHWSVTVGAKKKLSRPVINDIVFLETLWE